MNLFKSVHTLETRNTDSPPNPRTTAGHQTLASKKLYSGEEKPGGVNIQSRS